MNGGPLCAMISRQLWRDTLAEAVPMFRLRIHAYCLLANHYHLVLGTPEGNLSRALAWLQTTYTMRYNARHRRSGHLFQGRYKAQLVEADEYARWLVEYVHLNPVRPVRKNQPIAAERRAELDQYEWSSHQDYAGLRPAPTEWLNLDWLGYWGREVQEGQREYRQGLERWFGVKATNRWAELRGGLVLGGEALWDRVRGLLEGKEGVVEAAWTQEADGGERRTRVRELVGGETKWLQIWARVKLGGERSVDVAREYGYADGSAVTYVVKQVEQRRQSDEGISARIDAIEQEISRLKSRPLSLLARLEHSPGDVLG